MSIAKFNTWQNPDGTENYKCRAWVNFNGAGTVAIRAAGNVSSITDNGTGDYTVNFTNAMPDANYAMAGAVGGVDSATSSIAAVVAKLTSGRTTSSVRFYVTNSSSAAADREFVEIAIFR